MNYELAIVVIQRNNSGKVIDRSFQRFTCLEQFEEFKYSIIPQHLSGYEIHEVHLRKAQKPDGPHKHRGEKWCPYCAKWRRYLKSSQDGYVKCEICQISTKDFWFIKFNGSNPVINETPTGPIDSTKEEKRRLRRERRKARKLRGGK